MRTHVEFSSSKFPAYPDEMEKCNPGLWGKRLAEYIQQKLTERGIETSYIYPEDWGWAIPLKHEAFPMWIGCGRSQEDEDKYLVFIDPAKPMVRTRWFEKIDTTADVAKLADILDSILASDPEIRHIWWREGHAR